MEMAPFVQAKENLETARRRQAKLQHKLSQMPLEDICPDNPRTCPGCVQVAGYWLPCPHDCPHKAARRAYRDRQYLLSLGFGQSAAAPDWDRVPDDLRKALSTYCETIATRIGSGDGLTMAGNVGAGKTCSLALIALAAEGFTIIYRPMLSLFNELHTGNPTMEMLECELLLLDDLGTEYPSGLALSRFHELIDERWADRRSVVITTNRQKHAIEDDVKLTRIVDRLRQRNPFVATSASSQRRAAAVADWEEEQ